MVSLRFRWLSLMACFGVLVIHSRTFQTMPAPGRGLLLFQHLFSDALVRFSVPCFFAISGYWWMKSSDGAVTCLRKKVKTLLVPYLFWAVLGVALSFPLIAGNNYLTHRCLTERTVFEADTLWAFLDQLFGVSGGGPKAAMPLWFVKQLILVFAFVSAARPLFRLGRGFVALLLGLMLVFGGNLIPGIPHYPMTNCWLGWFLLGASIRVMRIETRHVPLLWFVLSGGVWVFLSVMVTMHLMSFATIPLGSMGMDFVMHSLALSGMMTCWGATGYLVRIRYPSFIGCLFFVYCFHEYVAGYWMSAMHYIFGKNDVEAMISYCLCPFVMLSGAVLVQGVLRRMAPRLLLVVSGGRSES